ncbi:hypothetical protein [Mitsuokella multacida]|nr:hypothetical protein [Mitsuokella multacida]
MRATLTNGFIRPAKHAIRNSIPLANVSSTMYWSVGLSTIDNISFGVTR